MSLKESLKIMIVDDMSTSRGLLVQALDEIGFKNHTYEASGEDALKKLSTQPVHLVISDFNMPGMNGLQLLKGLRENQTTARTGFILVTGSPTKEVIEFGKKLGMNNFLKKPFTTAQIKSCIEQVVGKVA